VVWYRGDPARGRSPTPTVGSAFRLSSTVPHLICFFFLFAADQTKDHGTKDRFGGKQMGAKERKTPWKKREKEVSGKL